MYIERNENRNDLCGRPNTYNYMQDDLETKKPQILDHNRFIGGVNCADHYGSMYLYRSFLCKLLKWRRDFFLKRMSSYLHILFKVKLKQH